MAGLGLLQLKVSVDQSWPDYLIIGVYFLFVLGIRAIRPGGARRTGQG